HALQRKLGGGNDLPADGGLPVRQRGEDGFSGRIERNELPAAAREQDRVRQRRQNCPRNVGVRAGRGQCELVLGNESPPSLLRMLARMLLYRNGPTTNLKLTPNACHLAALPPARRGRPALAVDEARPVPNEGDHGAR